MNIILKVFKISFVFTYIFLMIYLNARGTSGFRDFGDENNVTRSAVPTLLLSPGWPHFSYFRCISSM